MGDKCVICELPLGDKWASSYAGFGGLPLPCCEHCFEANDFRCKSLDDVKIKSIARRARLGALPFNKDGKPTPLLTGAEDG